jgi:hypothetical protein
MLASLPSIGLGRAGSIACRVREAALNPKVTDVHQTLAYRSSETNWKLFLFGLVFVLVGLYGAFFDQRSGRDGWPAAWFLLLLGGFIAANLLYRSLFPARPLLELSPDGILVRIAWVTQFSIPWHEVRGIDTTDVAAGFRITGSQARATSSNVTAVQVSRSFYERIIVIPALLRGPAWRNVFIPKETMMMQVALHHDVLGVSPEELRTAIEARWHAFRERLPQVPPRKAGLRVAWVVPAMLIVGMVIAVIVTSPGLWRESEDARSARYERERIESDRRFKQAEEDMRRVMEKTGEGLRRSAPRGWFDDDRAPARDAPPPR